VLISPLVAETVITFLQLWTPAYLMPQEALYPSIQPVLWALYGQGTPLSSQLLRFILAKVNINLFQWSGEWELSLETCKLVHILVHGNRNLARELMECEQWIRLVRACTTDQSLWETANLPGEAVVSLFAALTNSVQKGRETHRLQLWNQISSSVSERLQRLLNTPKEQKNSPRYLSSLSLCLDMIRGIVSASVDIQGTNVIYQFLSMISSSLISLLSCYSHRSDLITSILNIFAGFAGSNIVVLEAEEAQNFYKASLDLIREYGRIGQGRMKEMGSSEQDEEEFEDVKIMLELLEHIYSKDLVDFGPDNVDFSSQATIMGISILVAHLNETVLNFPTISRAFFGIVQDVVSTHPEKLFSILDQDSQNRMLAVLSFALSNHDGKVVSSSFDTLRELVSYEGSRTNQVFHGHLPGIVELLMKRLIQEEIAEQTIDSASDCLLAVLLVYSQQALDSTMEYLVRQQEDRASAREVRQAFAEIVQQAGVQCDSPLGRRNRMRFRKSTSSFIERIRRTIMRK